MTVRLTAQEKDMIQRKANEANLSLTDFLVASALQTHIYVAEDVRPLIIELKRIGNNVNQIAAKVNSGVYHSVGLQEVSDDLNRIYEQLCRIGRAG